MSGVNTIRIGSWSDTPASGRRSRGRGGPERCRRKFLRIFPAGFRDATYLDWERGYKAEAHARWEAELARPEFERRIARRRWDEVARLAVTIESRTNLLFSFEKMALRDAVRTPSGARTFATGLYEFLHGRLAPRPAFEAWCDAIARLPRRQTRVLTWPLVTVFGFLAQPKKHVFLKPNVTRIAARKYGFEFRYASRPNWDTYASLLDFARTCRRDLADLHPRDWIDIQSFLWVQGSDEY